MTTLRRRGGEKHFCTNLSSPSLRVFNALLMLDSYVLAEKIHSHAPQITFGTVQSDPAGRKAGRWREVRRKPGTAGLHAGPASAVAFCSSSNYFNPFHPSSVPQFHKNPGPCKPRRCWSVGRPHRVEGARDAETVDMSFQRC